MTRFSGEPQKKKKDYWKYLFKSTRSHVERNCIVRYIVLLEMNSILNSCKIPHNIIIH